MRWLRKMRFSMGVVMMLILTSATAFALFAKIRRYTDTFVGTAVQPSWKFDAPGLFLLAIVLTALALGAWKGHSLVQIMLQITLACLGCLSLIWICEAKNARAIRYWFQATFAVSVVIPLIARHIVKTEMPRGPRRKWWKKTCEAVFFSFLNLMLVSLGGFFESVVVFSGSALMEAIASVR